MSMGCLRVCQKGMRLEMGCVEEPVVVGNRGSFACGEFRVDVNHESAT